MRKWITISYSWKYRIVVAIALIVICGLIGISVGWFWYHEWVKPCKKVSEPAGDEIGRAELDFNERDALYKRTQAVEAKYRVGKEKPVKIYNGKWHKDFLEVMK